MKIVPENPCAKLSKLMVRARTQISGPITTIRAKNKLVAAIRTVAAIRHLERPNFRIAQPPVPMPIRATPSPYSFATLATCDFVNPMSR